MFSPADYLDNPLYQNKGLVFNYQHYSVHDGPGIRTLVFFKGCPLRCRWCANPESLSRRPTLVFNRKNCIGCQACEAACPIGAISFANIKEGTTYKYPQIDRELCNNCGECVKVCYPEALQMEGHEVTVAEVIEEVMKDEVFYNQSGGGITLSGGECMYQPKFALAILKAAKEQGLNTAIETTGACMWEDLERMIPVTDTFLYDCKHYDETKHRIGTGSGNVLLIDNLRRLLAAGANVIVRIPVIPGFNDSIADAANFGRLLNELGAKQVHLLPFHQMGEMKYEMLGQTYAYAGVKNLHDEDLLIHRKTMEAYHLKVQIGG